MKLIRTILRKEFSVWNLSLKHNKPSDFYTCQWQRTAGVNIYYMLYRLGVASVFFITFILSVVDINHLDQSAEDRAKWLIYLTHWGYAMCTLQSFMSACFILHAHRKTRTLNEPITDSCINPKLTATYWAIFSIATDAAFAITCIYWSFIFDVNKHPLDAMNILVHGINSVLMMIDLFMVAHPVRLLHCYWPFLFAVIYVVFNVIYYLAGGTDKNGQHYIYTILDWKKPGRSVLITFLALIFLVFLHFLTYCMFLLRKNIHRKLYSVTNNDKNLFVLNINAKDCISDLDYKNESNNHTECV